MGTENLTDIVKNFSLILKINILFPFSMNLIKMDSAEQIFLPYDIF